MTWRGLKTETQPEVRPKSERGDQVTLQLTPGLATAIEHFNPRQDRRMESFPFFLDDSRFCKHLSLIGSIHFTSEKNFYLSLSMIDRKTINKTL
jgi:hypothetical protein